MHLFFFQIFTWMGNQQMANTRTTTTTIRVTRRFPFLSAAISFLYRAFCCVVDGVFFFHSRLLNNANRRGIYICGWIVDIRWTMMNSVTLANPNRKSQRTEKIQTANQCARWRYNAYTAMAQHGYKTRTFFVGFCE